MKNGIKLTMAISLVVLAFLACSVTSLLPGGDSGLRPAGDLWSDVPKMDGLGASDLEVPLLARVMLQTYMTAMAGGTGSGDYAAFTTAASNADIQAFYTNERMAASGWQSAETDTCLDASEQGFNGLFCVFIKESANNQTGLVILGVPDEDNAAQTNVFFIRVENAVTPTVGG